MSVTCCPLSGNHDGGPSVSSTAIVKAGKEHQCGECREPIAKGQRHEVTTGMWDGAWSTYRTCLSCVEIRNHFACEGWIYGEVWNDIEANFFPDMKAGGVCLDGLSPEAKGRMFELRLAWLFDSEQEIDGAPPPMQPAARWREEHEG